jgi:hypothetical protein
MTNISAHDIPMSSSESRHLSRIACQQYVFDDANCLVEPMLCIHTVFIYESRRRVGIRGEVIVF